MAASHVGAMLNSNSIADCQQRERVLPQMRDAAKGQRLHDGDNLAPREPGGHRTPARTPMYTRIY